MPWDSSSFQKIFLILLPSKCFSVISCQNPWSDAWPGGVKLMWRMGQIFTAPSALQHCRVTGGRASLWGIGSFPGAVRGRLAARWTSHLFAELPFRCEGPTVFHGSASDGQRPRNSDRGPSLLLSAWPWEHALELCSADAKLATTSCHVQSTFHPTSQASWEMLRSYSTD